MILNAPYVLLAKTSFLWLSKEAQQKHLNQPHMSVVKALKEKYVLSTDILQETESTFEEE